ncbi:LacI family DNA-binding transcriptional regulator [Amycolatopsis thermoflava]|uniref:LacI family DNA-binding transcriptional regulator n=1 Tax=Amycolatopsis thermoflava TaxID=84480 RepID=UPI0036644973
MSKDERFTLIAVAKAAGVSKTTGSDALRDSGRVSERTKQHVVPWRGGSAAPRTRPRARCGAPAPA